MKAKPNTHGSLSRMMLCPLSRAAVLAGVIMLLTLSTFGLARDGVNDAQRWLAQKNSDAREATVDGQSEAADPAKLNNEKTLEFVGKHQPNMLKLLEFLKNQRPPLYQQALKEMSRSQQRLENLSKRDPQLYDIEIDLWNLRSELRLLAAEVSVKSAEPNAKQKKKLTELAQQQADQELAKLRLLKVRAEKQVAQLNSQIEQRVSNEEAVVAKTIQYWTNQIAKQSRD